MLSLIPRLRNHFDPLQARFDCFCRYGVQVESWFKGEFLLALDEMQRERAISGFDREVRSAGKRIDFRVELAGACHWLELKHWLIGFQKGTKYAAQFCFGDPSAVGISRDVAALLACPPADKRWLMIFATGRPSPVDWREGVKRHNEKFKHSLVSHTTATDFPPAYFLGVLDVGRPDG